MTDATVPHRLQHERLRVALYGIERVTGEACDKTARRRGDRSRAEADEGLRPPLFGHTEIPGRQLDGGGQRGRGKQGLPPPPKLPETQEATPDRRSTPATGDKIKVNGAAERSAPKRQNYVRGFRSSCRTISVSLKDTGPLDGRLDRKRRVTS